MSRSSGNCWLYHGPGARDLVLADASAKGRLMGSYGEDKFNIEVARRVVAIMSSTPVGDRLATLVAGPLDKAQIGSLDPLLKSIEEFNGELLQPYLWAEDLGGVSGTIRSRCFVRWCPGEYATDPEVAAIIGRVCQAAVDKEYDVVIDRISGLKGIKDYVFDGTQVFRAAAHHLSKQAGTGHLVLWESLRTKLGANRALSPNEVIEAFLLSET